MRAGLAGITAAAFLAASLPAQAQDVKVGFVATFSGSAAVIGNDMRDAFELGLDHLGRKLGGLNAAVIYEDDQLKPEIGKQKTDKLIEADKVNFLTGYIWSNVLLASLKAAIDSQTFIIGATAGPYQIAGELCSPWFFSTSWQGQQVMRAIAERMNLKGVKTAYLLAPNYAAGRDVLAGLKAAFQGRVIGEDYTRWPDQLDFSAELTKARALKPDAVFAFYPGNPGVQFLAQYSQFGLRDQIPLYTSGIIDQLSLPLLKNLALGILEADHWVNDLPNDANKRFVAGFEKKYGRVPSAYAARAYDVAFLIDSAVRATGGDLANKDAVRDAMRKADFASVRGPFKYGNNHFPIQNFYLYQAVASADGSYALKTVATALVAHQDHYHDRCPMKW